MLNKNKGLVLLSVLLLPVSAQALRLTIGDRTYINPVFTASADAAADAMEAQFNTTIGSAERVQDFLGAVSAANSTSGRSILTPGVHLQSDLMIAFGASGTLGLGPGASLSEGISIPTNSLPPIGVGARTGLTVAVSGKTLRSPFRGLDPKRLMMHASFFTMDLSPYIGRGVEIEAMHAAVGMSYEIFGPKPWTPIIRYNGIRLSTGLAYGTFNASYRTPFELTQSSGGVTTTWDNDIDIAVNSKIFSISTEATTGFRLAWVLNLYTGFGVDFNFGSASITGGSSGPVTGTAVGVPVFSATGAVSTDDSDSTAPPIAQVRWMIGTQIDLGNFGIYAQGSLSTPSTYGIHAGARASF